MTPTFIIAELGLGHGGILGEAIELIRAVAGAGADAAKLQDHRWQDIPRDANHPPWFNGATSAETREDYLRRTAFSNAQWEALAGVAHGLGLEFIVSPFSTTAAKQLAGIVDKFKVASGQVTNIPLLETLRELGKPVILSSGMTSAHETAIALNTLGHRITTVLHCTSSYPCAPESVGLKWLDRGTGWVHGLSDHTLGTAASLGAIALGATVIERHVGWDRRQYGSDARHSMTIDEFAAFVKEARDLEKMLDPTYDKDAMAKQLESVRREFLYAP